jgi:hypothetical protein
MIACAVSMALISPVMGKEFKRSANVCWLGKSNVLATSKKDVGWSWKLDFSSTPDVKGEEVLTGNCVGSGGVMNGKREDAPYFCTTVAPDGSKYMGRGTGNPQGSKSVYFGGTGKFKGLAGTSVGGPSTKNYAPKGSFAACRHIVTTYTLPD